jgi:hypothetical protein
LAWIEHVGGSDYRYDARNEAAHKLCNSILHTFFHKEGNFRPSTYLPLI